MRKELAAAFQTPKEHLQTEEELDHNISCLQECSINAAGVHFAVQQSVINAQVCAVLVLFIFGDIVINVQFFIIFFALTI